MKQDIDLKLAKRILRSLGLKIVSSIDIGFTDVDGIPWLGINLDDKRRKSYVYSEGRDGQIYATFDSAEELLACILFTKNFIIDYGHGEYSKMNNLFSGMTKEQAAIKLDLES